MSDKDTIIKDADFSHAETLFERAKHELNYIYDLATTDEEYTDEEFDLSITGELKESYDRYGEKELINYGGMKEIYRVEDTITGRAVAMAQPRVQSPNYNRESFLCEARLTALLSHPNIMPVYDIGLDNDGNPFFTMKLTGGKNLNDLMYECLENSEDWPLLQRLNIFNDICEGVAYSHSLSILHLDLKPHNIQVGEFGEVLICDWGLAKLIFEKDKTLIYDAIDPRLTGDMTIHGEIKGTPGFMAPEQVDTTSGKRDERTDIYALGGLLYFLLTGTTPVAGESVHDILKKTSEGALVKARDNSIHFPVPIALEAIAMKALSSDPSERYQTVEEMKIDIDAYLNGFSPSAEQASLSRALILMIKRHRVLTGFLLFALLFGTIFTVYFQHSSEKSEKLLAMYTTEKKRSGELSEMAIEKYLEQAQKAISWFKFGDCYKIIEKIEKIKPNFQEAARYRAKLYFYDHKFNASVKEFERFPKLKKDHLYTFAKEYAAVKSDDVRLNKQQFHELLLRLDQYWLQRPFLGNEQMNHTSVKDYMEHVHTLFIHLNPNQKPVNFVFEQINGKNYLDLSGNPNMHEIHISAMATIPLHYVNMDGLKVSYYNSQRLGRMPLIELSIVSKHSVDLSFTKNAPTLKKITLAKNVYPRPVIDELRERMTVVLK